MKRMLAVLTAALLLVSGFAYAEAEDLTGEWILAETIVDGISYYLPETNTILHLNPDGTAALSGTDYGQKDPDADTEPYTWVLTEAGLDLIHGEETVSFSLADGKLNAEMNGREIVFAREAYQVPAEQAEQKKVLTMEEIMDIAFAACPVDRILASHRRVSMHLDGTGTVAFHTDYGDYYYLIDTVTGEILDREEADIEAARSSEGFREPLSYDEVHDIVSAACPIDLGTAQRIRVQRDENGLWTFSFGSVFGDFFYQIDGYSGEILDSIEPDVDAARAQEGFVEPLTGEQAMDAAAAVCPLRASAITKRKVSKHLDGTWTITFGSEYGDFIYMVDGLTGEILEKTEPDIPENGTPAASSDPFGDAISACFSSLPGYRGGAENIKVSMTSRDGQQAVMVTFDWNGESYTMFYGTETQKLLP